MKGQKIKVREVLKNGYQFAMVGFISYFANIVKWVYGL